MIGPLLCAALVVGAPADDDGTIAVNAGLFAARPLALETGQSLGPSTEGTWSALRYLDVLGTIDLGFAGAQNRTFALRHTELRLTGGVATGLTFGAGRFGLAARIGGAFVHESRTRHQASRLTGQTSFSGWSLGPLFGADAFVRVFVLDDWAFRVSAGPTLTWMKVTDETVSRLGWAGRLQITWRPGG